MDEKDFKQHLRDLAHGHHHPEEHDWSGDAGARKSSTPARPNRAKAPAKSARKKKQS
jgi:hypothetical protein